MSGCRLAGRRPVERGSDPMQRQHHLQDGTGVIEVYARAGSPGARPVLWALQELALPVVRRDLPTDPAVEGADHVAINPLGRPAAAARAAFALADADAILRHICQALAGGEALHPGDATAWAETERWIAWRRTLFAPVCRELEKALGPAPDAGGATDTPRHAADLQALATSHLAALDRHLDGRDYLLGPRFTIADVALGAPIHRYLQLAEGAGAFVGVQTWYARLCYRDAFRAQVMAPAGRAAGERYPIDLLPLRSGLG